MNPPRTYDELLAAATKEYNAHSLASEADLVFSARKELNLRHQKHGEAMVAALREFMSALITRPGMSGKENPVSWNISTATMACQKARAVLAALDGKDAT